MSMYDEMFLEQDDDVSFCGVNLISGITGYPIKHMEPAPRPISGHGMTSFMYKVVSTVRSNQLETRSKDVLLLTHYALVKRCNSRRYHARKVKAMICYLNGFAIKTVVNGDDVVTMYYYTGRSQPLSKIGKARIARLHLSFINHPYL